MAERVFISYSSEDMRWAQLIKDNLEANGISCWMANSGGIAPGEDYIEEISRALDGCSVFVLVLSENAEKSAWVAKELGTAITGRKKIIPVKISSYQISRFRFQLENIQIFEPGNLQEMADQLNLVNAVKKALRLKEVAEDSFVSSQTPPIPPAGKGDKAGGGTSGTVSKKLALPLAACVVVIVAVAAFLLGRNGFKGSSAEPADQTVQNSDTQDKGVQEEQDAGTQDKGVQEEQNAGTQDKGVQEEQDAGTQDKGVQEEQDAGIQDMGDPGLQDAGIQDMEDPGLQNAGMPDMGDQPLQDSGVQPVYGSNSHLDNAILAEQNDERFYYNGDYLDVGICSREGEMVSTTLTAPENGYYFFEMRLCEYTNADTFILNSELPFLPDISVLPDPVNMDSDYFCAVAYLEAGNYILKTNSERCRPMLTPVTVLDDPLQYAEGGRVYVYFLDVHCEVNIPITFSEGSSRRIYYYSGQDGKFLNDLYYDMRDNIVSIDFPAGVAVADLRYL